MTVFVIDIPCGFDKLEGYYSLRDLESVCASLQKRFCISTPHLSRSAWISMYTYMTKNEVNGKDTYARNSLRLGGKRVDTTMELDICT